MGGRPLGDRGPSSFSAGVGVSMVVGVSMGVGVVVAWGVECTKRDAGMDTEQCAIPGAGVSEGGGAIASPSELDALSPLALVPAVIWVSFVVISCCFRFVKLEKSSSYPPTWRANC